MSIKLLKLIYAFNCRLKKMIEDFENLMNTCGIIDFGIPYKEDYHEDDCDGRCQVCRKENAYLEKQMSERSKFVGKTDKNKELYLRRYSEFKTKWDKIGRQCYATQCNPFILALPDVYEYGYSGECDEGSEFGQEQFLITPFNCRKRYVEKAYEIFREQISDIKHLITELKSE